MMNPFRCVILDDEPLAVALVEAYVKQRPELLLAATFTNPVAALKYVQTHPCDLLFLDIQMPELTGIQVMKILEGQTQIILTTAYPEYALEGFEHSAVDYLLKPVSRERFDRAVDKYLSAAVKKEVRKAPDFLFVKSEHRLLKVMLDDILWLEAMRDYVAIHHTKGRKILTLQSLRSFEEILPHDAFFRIHKSYIVALPKISFVERNRVFIQDQPIPVSDSHRAAFLMRIKGS